MNKNLRVNKTNFHMKGFAHGLALKQRRKATRKSPTVAIMFCLFVMLFLQKAKQSASVEQAMNLFHTGNPMFLKTLWWSFGVLIILILGGIIFNVQRTLRRKRTLCPGKTILHVRSNLCHGPGQFTNQTIAFSFVIDSVILYTK